MAKDKAVAGPDLDRFREIKKSWAEYAEDAGEDVARNMFIAFRAGDVAADLESLIVLAKARKPKDEAARERLRQIDGEWREYREYNRADIRANKEVRFAVGKLVGQVQFLVGLIEGKVAEPEPAAV